MQMRGMRIGTPRGLSKRIVTDRRFRGNRRGRGDGRTRVASVSGVAAAAEHAGKMTLSGRGAAEGVTSAGRCVGYGRLAHDLDMPPAVGRAKRFVERGAACLLRPMDFMVKTLTEIPWLRMIEIRGARSPARKSPNNKRLDIP